MLLLRLSLRLPMLLAWLLVGAGLGLLWRARLGRTWYDSRSGRALVRGWMARLGRILGLRVTVKGQPLSTALLVANHISWLDIPALAARVPGRFVAKAEVRHWPLLGWLAELSGTRFLRRNSLAGMRVLLEQVTRDLEAGRPCLVFPEGTSTDGSRVGPFFPALLQTAITAAVPVQCVAIRYGDGRRRDEQAPFIDDDVFVRHLLGILGRGHTRVELHFSPPLQSLGLSRHFLAARCRGWIASRLGLEAQPGAGMGQSSGNQRRPPSAATDCIGQA